MKDESDFYKKCIKNGYTDVNNDEQLKGMKVLAMELNLEYRDIDTLFEKSKLDFEKKQEEKKKEKELKKARTVRGSLLYTVNTINHTIEVYRRPDNSLYCLSHRNRKYATSKPTESEGIEIGIETIDRAYYKEVKPKTYYTGATVGGVTTGGFHTTSGGITVNKSNSDHAYIIAKTGNIDEAIGSIQLNDFASFVFEYKYSKGLIKCIVGNDKSAMSASMAASNSGNTALALNFYQLQKEKETFSIGYCESVCSFISKFTNNFPSYSKKDEQEIYEYANGVAKFDSEQNQLIASRMFLYIKDYKDSSEKAIAARERYQVFVDERIKIAKDQRLKEEKANKTIIIALVIITIICMIFAIAMNIH